MTGPAPVAGPRLPPGPAWLFVPGDRPDRWGKASARADSVIVDLENAVAAADKGRARTALAGVNERIDPRRLVVRINAAGTPWFAADVEAVRAAGVRMVMVPKVRVGADLARIGEALPGVALVALCETAASIVSADSIAAVDGCAGLMWGGEDLAVDLAATGTRDADGRLTPAMRQARTQLRFAAAAAGIGAIDAPVLRIDRPEWVTREAGEAFGMGHHAKACIHPDQVGPVRDGFGPSVAELARARRIIAAAEGRGVPGGAESGHEGSPDEAVGVFGLDGEMVDRPVVELARNVVARDARR